VARRANSVEGFYAGDISSKVCGKSNPGFAQSAWTKTPRHSSRREKLELLLIALYLKHCLDKRTVAMRWAFY
jgi:hypothetical protein